MAEETGTVSRGAPVFGASMKWRRFKAHFFVALGLLSVLLGVLTLVVLLVDVIGQSAGWIDWQFFHQLRLPFSRAGRYQSRVFRHALHDVLYHADCCAHRRHVGGLPGRVCR